MDELDTDLDIFEQIKPEILNGPYINTEQLLEADLDIFDQIDPQQLIYKALLEEDLEIFFNSELSAISNTEDGDLNITNYVTFCNIGKEETSTQISGSPMHWPSELDSMEQEVLPLITPAYEEEFTISQILNMFKEPNE